MMLRVYYLLIVLLNLAAAIFCADKYSREDFPSGFVFGPGTSAYQVEGAASEDGRSPSIWDTVSYEGKMDGATGDASVDEYHNHIFVVMIMYLQQEDVKLMAETGLDAYRFSISWPRLIPNGRGLLNPKAVLYYNNLINERISHGIEAHVALYHYDHPQLIEYEYGGWLSRKIVKNFIAYADVCLRKFGDRVLHWTTLNEPNVFLLYSYDVGMLPPYRCSSPFGLNCSQGNSTSKPYLVFHHLLLAHASAVRLYRKKYQGKQLGFNGINLFVYGTFPLTNSTEDVLATQRATEFLVGFTVIHPNPVVFGDYPETVKKNAGLRLPAFTIQESKQVKGSFDYLGVNHYVSIQFKDNSASLNSEHRDYRADMAAEMIFDVDNSTFEYPIHALGMQAAQETSSFEDTSRVKYMHGYVESVLDAIRNGSNVRGYFTWSLLDAFELMGRYETCFGLYCVALSAHWYSQFLRGKPVGSDVFIQLGKHFSPLSASS
ncbi:hypothetical protein P3X46_015137 [Hevea brasiliensis]|uniref:Beta-glucosidase n=1 Tax=Hevea brasiliensis TaxID=3981 RepID=A0ABQ9LWC1_HEVBR|nr:hypothetical protein P3X46_015137 [Hevea brasiliensis]